MLKLISPLLLILMTVALQLVLLAGLLLLKQGEPISPLLSLSRT